ncbi:type VI secretion protein [Caulobacter sp. Root656]|nr:type VI secretion protein [Caulobacter sp. Root656]
MAADDEFEPRLGRIRDRGSGAGGKARGFVSEVMTAARRAGGGALDLEPRGHGPRPGRGGSRAPSRAASRRVVIKSRIIRHQGARFRAAPLSQHLRYLRREGVNRDGQAGEVFDREGPADHEAFAARCEGDRHHFRFMVSPEDAEQLQDIRATTRDLMGQVERDLHTRLDWVAVDHWNTDNPHVHVLVRGVADDGRDLVISGDYIGRGMRQRAMDLVSLELGPRSEREMAASLDKEVIAERWTSLDWRLRERLDGPEGLIDLRPTGGRLTSGDLRLVGRAQTLERFGLAEATGPGRWRLAADLEPRLRALGERGDIIKTLHKAMGQGRDPAALVILGAGLAEPVFGRLVDRGLHDELTGQAYAVVDGADGRLHHFKFGDLSATGDTPIGGLVEIRTRVVEDAKPQLELVHRSDLSVDAQVRADGATWLDRQTVSRTPQPLAPTGFGAELRGALERRLAHLEARGLAQRQDGRLVPVRNLVATLRARELSRVAGNLRAEAGAPRGEPAAGETVSGVYRRRIDLASGRFAMIDDGLGFQLVPWTRALDQRLGQEVKGTITPGGGVDWQLGRKRGIGL